ncbi:MAG TPA: beta-propeller fold lactonase family protein [Acidimicrobiales bacterium]|nr:beta-propeller fold lactonase family protein [Acidimicrobiales bacterium]
MPTSGVPALSARRSQGTTLRLRRPGAVAAALALLTSALVMAVGVSPAAAAVTRAYVANQLSDTVSVIDTATNSVVATVAVGAGPSGVAARPDGSRVYVANATDDTISVIDTATNTVVATVAVGDAPVGVAVRPDGSRVYVTNADGNTVSVIDTATNTVVATVAVGDHPTGVAVGPDGSRVYVTNYGGDTVSVIDTATNTVVATVPVGDAPRDVAVSPDGSRAYVTNFADDTVSVIDTATNTVVATVAVGDLPDGVAVSPDGSRVYVANQVAGTVSVINTATNTVVATVAVGHIVEGVAVSPDGSRVYVTNAADDTVSVIDTATNTVVATLAVGDFPVDVEVAVVKARPAIATVASAGGVLGTAVNDVATLTGGSSPTGTVTFRLYSDAACTMQVFTSTNPVIGGTTATSGSFAPSAPGTYYWTAVYSGDGGNDAATSPCGSPNESVTITKASPHISTQASPGNLVGAPVRDVATLAGGVNPTGTVTFRLYSDSTCTAQVFTSTNPLTAGATAASDWFTPTSPGTYRWTAVYSGDANNDAATSPCNAPNESVTMAPFTAPAFTRTITGDFLGPLAVNAGESVLITNARVVGPVTVNPGGALTVVDSKISRGITADMPAFFSLCGTEVSAPSPGVALSVTNAGVPILIGDPAAGCSRNRFAGQVNLGGNLAVTFGGNIVSHNLTVNDNGPGNTVIKANNIFGTFACSGNKPAPTNAGQPNTAGSKTGQCGTL